MDKLKEFAALLDGRQYNKIITPEEDGKAKEQGIVIVYGESDDLCELHGAIFNDMCPWCEEHTLYLGKNDMLNHKCECGDFENCGCEYCCYQKEIDKARRLIEILWDENGFQWSYETDIPHETFIIYDGKTPFCQGIVFDIASLQVDDKTNTNNDRNNYLLFSTLELLREKIKGQFSDWKDADDWIFSQLDFTVGEIEEIYKGRETLIHTGSCVSNPKEKADD